MADKNDPLPSPPSGGADAPRKNLNPLFGGHCTSQTYALKAYVRGSYHMRMDAFIDDPVKKTWTVQKTTTITETSAGGMFFGVSKERTRTQVQKVKTRASFNDVLDEMLHFEKLCHSRGADYVVQNPDAEAMGFKHFRAFAEREGYVFDSKGQPHARPHKNVLPACDAGFVQTDIDRADRRLQRPENEFDNAGPASKAPQTHFLFDQFTRAVHVHSMDDKIAELRVLDILDRFAQHIHRAHDNLQTYCKQYHELGQGGLIDDALDALRLAGAAVRQLKAYGVESADFESFVLQCKITCHVLHAEGLYDLMNRGEGDFVQNEILFRQRVDKAIETFRRIDDSEQGIKTLQDMIVQTPRPEVPEAMTVFLRDYDAQRAAWRQTHQAGRDAAAPQKDKKPPFKP
ncbi:MAG: hypothetical protein ACK4PK_03750 [Alphaproteobacteria bacterium]